MANSSGKSFETGRRQGPIRPSAIARPQDLAAMAVSTGELVMAAQFVDMILIVSIIVPPG